MTDLVLRLDPNEGCGGCPFYAYSGGRDACHARGDSRSLLQMPEKPAPQWCPLRAGRVVVEACGGEDG